jgi:hypothetical protein
MANEPLTYAQLVNAHGAAERARNEAAVALANEVLLAARDYPDDRGIRTITVEERFVTAYRAACTEREKCPPKKAE